jgi:nucleoside-diphosphate-sugar epimerase
MEEIFGKYKDIMRRIPDLTKAKRILGYEPKVSMEEAIRQIISHRKLELQKDIAPCSNLKRQYA